MTQLYIYIYILFKTVIIFKHVEAKKFCDTQDLKSITFHLNNSSNLTFHNNVNF